MEGPIPNKVHKINKIHLVNNKKAKILFY